MVESELRSLCYSDAGSEAHRLNTRFNTQSKSPANDIKVPLGQSGSVSPSLTSPLNIRLDLSNCRRMMDIREEKSSLDLTRLKSDDEISYEGAKLAIQK
jgi:hypothetical protein